MYSPWVYLNLFHTFSTELIKPCKTDRTLYVRINAHDRAMDVLLSDFRLFTKGSLRLFDQLHPPFPVSPPHLSVIVYSRVPSSLFYLYVLRLNVYPITLKVKVLSNCDFLYHRYK